MNALRRWWLRRRAVKPTLLRLERDDVVVLTARSPLTRQQADAIKAAWDKRFPRNTVVVLDGVAVTGVLRTAPLSSVASSFKPMRDPYDSRVGQGWSGTAPCTSSSVGSRARGTSARCTAWRSGQPPVTLSA